MEINQYEGGKVKKALLSLILTVLLLNSTAVDALANTWDYRINTTDTPVTVDFNNTSAVVDTTNNEIRLPANTASVISFWPDGSPDYIVMTQTKIIHFSFNGTGYDENTILDITPNSTPKAISATGPFPDVKLAAGTEIQHMSFDGAGYVRNTPLEKTGVNASALSAKQGEFVALVGNEAQRYRFDGSTMVRVPSLEPGTLTNPIDVELFPDSLNMAVLESDRLKVFRWDSSGNAQSPVDLVTGISNAKDISTTGAGDVAVVLGNEVRHFSFDGTYWYFNSALSVQSGLTNPTAVALRYGSLDKIIVDGNVAKYFSWDGSKLVYDSAKSKTIPGLGSGAYRTTAVVQSLGQNPGHSVSKVRVRAYHVLPDGTSVTWSVTANGTTWVKKWRVRGTSTGTVCEVSQDNGVTWKSIGDASKANPDTDTPDLWTDVTAGTSVRWRAELATTNTAVTPKIKPIVAGGVAVSLSSGSPPLPPVVPTSGSCYTTTTPTITWSYSDPDGDAQYAYQLQVKRQSDGVLIYDSGEVISSQTQHKINTSTDPSTPGPLWNSGTYQYTVQIRVWDSSGMVSEWSTPVSFCVVAFERPRIIQIISPPPGQTSPDPNKPDSHLLINPNMTQAQLPRVKAGAKVVMYVDSIGPITNITPQFPYGSGQTATVNIPSKMPDNVTVNPLKPVGSETNRWCIEFWTSPDLSVCPNNTLVKMRLSGSSTNGAASLNIDGSAPYNTPGVVVTDGSVYGDWVVVNVGRD